MFVYFCFLLSPTWHVWVFVCIQYECSTEEGQKIPLRLELQLIVSCSVDSGIPAQVVWKNSLCL